MPDRVLTQDVLDTLQHQLSEQHAILEEVKKVRRQNRIIRWVCVGLAAVLLLASFAIYRNYANSERIDKAVDQIEQVIEVACLGRNTSLRELRRSQLEANIRVIDQLKAGIDAVEGPSPEREDLAADVKARLQAEYDANEANPEVPDQDCDGDGTPGGLDADDYLP